jgi:sulfur-oxidizing protein SoxB
MSGQQIKDALEASAEARFSSDPLARNGLDMMRMGGVGFTLSPGKANGARISNLGDLARGAPLQMSGQYRVSDWAVSQGIGNGPEIMALLQRYVRRRKRIEAGAAHVVVV